MKDAQIKSLRRAGLWAVLIVLGILAMLSIIGAFIGVDKSMVLFNSPPTLVVLVVFGTLLSISFVLYKRLLLKPGLLVMHLGVLFIIVGSMLGSNRGHALVERLSGKSKTIFGYMPILEHEASNRIMDKTFKQKIGELPFQVKLNDFWIEYYEPDTKHCELFLTVPGGNNSSVKQIPVHWKIGEQLDVKQIGVKLTVLEYFDSAKVIYPKNASPRVLEIVSENGKKSVIPVEVGQEITLQDTQEKIRIVQVFSHLMVQGKGESRRIVNVPGSNANPAVKVEIEFPDGKKEDRFVMQRFSMHATGSSKTQLKYLINAPTGIKADPSTGLPAMKLLLKHRGKEFKGLLVFRSNQERHVNISLAPLLDESKNRHSGHNQGYDQARLFLVRPQGMIKDFKSDLSILKNGDEVARKVIEVNDPLHFGGYHFYQNSYDSANEKYSVLAVKSDSGLQTVYIGFILMVFGTFWWCWLQPGMGYIKKRWKRNGN